MSSDVRVHGWGRMDARIVLIGEAPGPHECKLGEPFVGPSGKRQAEWWKKVGLSRGDFRIENVCEYMPPGIHAEGWDRETWEAWMCDLHIRLSLLTDPWLIVPTGNYGLYALTGKGKVHWHQRDGKTPRPGITDWRGSILSYTDRNGRVIKVIPTIHAAATFNEPRYEALIQRDWERIAQERHTKEINVPKRVHMISPTVEDVEAYAEHTATLTASDMLMVDIENPEYPIACVGFSSDPQYSLTIPTTQEYWKSGATLAHVWNLIEYMLRDCVVPLGAHNVFHERYWFYAERGLTLARMIWDTMYLHHALDPSAPHSLEYCASIDTREPFWKHEAKDPEDQRKYTSNLAAFYTYNGKDCCIPVELFWLYIDRLQNQTRETSTGPITGLEYYLQHYAQMFEPLLQLGRTGVRIDEGKRAERYAQLIKEVAEIRHTIENEYQLSIYGKKALSTKKLQKWLYEDLQFPKQIKKRKGGVKTATTDEVAIRKLLRHKQALVQPEIVEKRKTFSIVGQHLLDSRRKAKLAEFYHESRVDADGRFRSSIQLNTEAGRLNSKANQAGTGSNQQNVDREARDIFLADEGCIGVQLDLSQAEGRVFLVWLYNLTKRKDLLDMARSHPSEFDMHTANAALIYNKPESQVTKDERQFGKVCIHGAQRRMGGQKISDEASKEGKIIDPEEAEWVIEQYKKRVPLDTFFQWVMQDVARAPHRLYDTWGGVLDFSHDRLDDDTFRRAFSFRMQPEVARIMNQWGFLPMQQWLQEHEAGQINVHAHDALFMSLNPEMAYDAVCFLQDSLERPRVYGGTELLIPATIGIGKSWKLEHEWKRRPTREEFNRKVKEIMS